ncbi:calcium-translocating P-type ATPase, SERCA-type [Sedimentibacter sp. MB31-C6]|uniref:calcium-translocating P-type ATPase, SERCA-type n=1 Tax=Sedimentibacter sp. MB31-C6 TaxID=3109366 RepID=UPI002DDDA482|nr:calcium-translocating P-type ATPase, SERCA-type [Sedimentibacter sp. MB36-C1]WSI05064.1 calcium-translocating P-type ATPase, SERCA-type [Sedimentibacter sp. MB36-C1]
MEWYNKGKKETVSELLTNENYGLKTQEAEQRLQKYGRNELEEQSKKSFLTKLIAQFADFLIIILVAAAGISAVVGETEDAIVILAIVFINAILGIYQEGKAEKSVEALQKMSAPNAKVIRDGNQTEIPAAEIVPGDIVVLEAGDIIPADLRLIESSNLKIEEASLTGESVPVEKDAKAIIGGSAGIGDRHNMGFSSTIVTYGRGKGVVVETGHHTEIGNIATKIQTYGEEQTPLQIKLNQLGKVLGTLTILICIVVFGVGLLQGREVLEMLLTSISLAVAAIPEGLPAIVTIVLAIGMNRMADRNAIVKKLLAVETLGATSVICSDKTGTLTQNEMTVVKAYVDDKILEIEGGGYEPVGAVKLDGKEIDINTLYNLNNLASIGALSNDAYLDNSSGVFKIVGDPTEGAIVTFAGKLGKTTNDLNKSFPRVEELPFDSARKMMSTFHENYIKGKVVSFTKGAPDIVISKCTKIALNGEIVDFTKELKNRVLSVNIKFAKSALRVLSAAYKVWDELPQQISPETVETDMIFVGLVGMIDPARPEAKDAIKECKDAGIEAVMITGDYKETAFAIAKDLGMAESEDQAMMGEELDNLSEDELKEVVKKTKVYARVSPEHKVKIVTALKENGHITSMTGDGVNDALALKKADIGVSMGITGTDVAKNTAEVILTDDNFATIVNAVEEGRIIFSNIKKFVFFLLSCNIGEIFLVFISILIGWEVPLMPIQLLWLNLVTDSFPAMALGVENAEPGIMNHPPRDTKEPILDKGMYGGILFQAMAIAAASLFAYYWAQVRYGIGSGLIHARSIVFATLITAELLRAFSSRSQVFSLFKIGLFSNKRMVQAVFVSFALTVLVLYLPILNDIFNVVPLTFQDWEIVLMFAFIPLISGEVYKMIFKNK